MSNKIEVLTREVRLSGVNNPCFKPIEFDGIKKGAGLNSFILTAIQWIERTGAIGIQFSSQIMLNEPILRGMSRASKSATTGCRN